ncbi:unnamed protein product [Parnassius mnemosyne]|uniref:Uncharacterized protein n=1 Tax=Parnassius mnemosyne TaxID=213953 RepID=A0AAV1M4P2_9NEOP
MFHFIHPFTAIVAGPSGCGKSNFVTNFIKSVTEICNCDFNQITWCFDEMQPLYNLPNVNYHQGIPNLNMFDGENPHLVIIDDLMRESDGRIVDIFTKGSHHRNLSAYRDATLEAHGYLMVDLKQNTNDFCRIKTNVFPFNGFCTVYVPTKEFKYTKNQTIEIIAK